MKRNLYTIEFERDINGSIIDTNQVKVSRRDQLNWVTGYVHRDGSVREVFAPHPIPKYIIKEALAMMTAEEK